MADLLRLEDIAQLTLEYGEGWAYPHARRLLSLVGQIGAGIQYDPLTEILPRTDLNPDQKAIVLESIERHDYRDSRPVSSDEALLLREADFLDFLGVIGMAREFAWGPNDLRKCYQRILKRREGIQGRFTIPAAKILAEVRLERMGRFLDLLLEESSGFL